MRRPSKELVDAVVDHSRRTSVEPPPTAPSSAHVMIKEEPDEEGWKPMGATGSLRGVDGAEAGSPLRQKLDRKEESEKDKKPERQKLNSTAAERAIEKMIEDTSTGKRKSLTALSFPAAPERIEPPQTKEEKMCEEDDKADMAIFEFTSSSPPAKPDARPKISLASAVREKRRHSSVPSSAASEERKTDVTSRQEGSLSTMHKRTASGSSKTVTATGLAKSTATARAALREKEREREKRTSRLPSSGSGSDLRAKESDSREGRAASRRKSMLV